MAKPLTDLTRKGVEFHWDSKCAESFERLKHMLTSAPVLQIYDPEAEQQIHTDASDFACGAVLL